jgi:glycerol-3-phosphate acyltransferase PlsY
VTPLLVLAYALGSTSPATLIASRHAIDIRTAGSGNPGATNVLRLLGLRLGITVLLLDFTKGALPVLISRLLELTLLDSTLVGLAAILGHTFPVFYRFKGGKGVATAAGVVLVLHPTAFLGALIGFALVYYLRRLVSLASIVAAIVLAAISSHPTQLSDPLSSDALNSWFIFLISGLVIFRHSGNIRRLVRGDEKSSRSRYHLRSVVRDPRCRPHGLNFGSRTIDFRLS